MLRTNAVSGLSTIASIVFKTLNRRSVILSMQEDSSASLKFLNFTRLFNILTSFTLGSLGGELGWREVFLITGSSIEFCLF